jgi:hypothetical protein
MPAHILLTPRLVLRIMNACVAYVTAMGILTAQASTVWRVHEDPS